MDGGGDTDGPELFQVSTLGALAHGANRGGIPIGEVLAHGDLGVGTFEGLAGEAVIVDGVAYMVAGHEEVSVPDASVLSPYAVVTRFAGGEPVVLPPFASMAELGRALDALRTDDRHVAAFRIEGRLDRMTLRVVCGGREGETLAEVAGRQFEAEHSDVDVTIVGFWTPAAMLGVDVVGYHLHVVSADRSLGGHLYDAAGDGLRASVQTEGRVHVVGGPRDPVDPAMLAHDLGTSEERPTGPPEG